uniref:Tubulin-specific chaperone B n=2 Tax=Lygus hesperus TaxID=30085 RepID=A0A0A9YSM7_LYGHE
MEVQSALRDYLTGDERKVQDGYVLLDLEHNLLTRKFKELQFHLDTDVEDLRMRIYRHCGSLPEYMELRVGGTVLEDGKALREYGVKNGDVVWVIDHNPNSQAANGGLDDVSQVQKYVIPEEKYDQLENTYRAWKRKMLEKDPNWLPPWIQ